MPTPALISLFDLVPLVQVLIPSWSILSQIFSSLFISPLLFLSINPIQVKEPYLPILFLNVPLVVKVETLLLSVRIISNWEIVDYWLIILKALFKINYQLIIDW